MRHALALLLTVATLSCAAAQEVSSTAPANFDAFKVQLWPQAQAKGITRATFDLAFKGITPDSRVLATLKRQPEYGKPIGDYVNSIASPSRIETGKQKAEQWADTFAREEKVYGVDRWVLLALWGIETSFGDSKDRYDVVRSIATMVQAGYRDSYFRGELLTAMKILQDKHIDRDKMFGSWAGAMGQPQFMPSSFLDLAVDFSGDGKRDIWTNVPDVIGSMGHYMAKSKWKAGLPWGFEVVLPEKFDHMKSRGTFKEWAERGVKRADGGEFPQGGNAFMLFPSGAKGPVFLVTDNFNVIKAYNNSDVYAIAVGHLADRMHGGPKIKAPWPTEDPQLAREQRIALQKRLQDMGYTVKDFQGRLDFDIRDAIRVEQKKIGFTPDGHPTAAFLTRIGARVN
jgi:lytic murein transglycosylase